MPAATSAGLLVNPRGLSGEIIFLDDEFAQYNTTFQMLLSEGWIETSADFSRLFRSLCELPENRGIVEHLGFITYTFAWRQRRGHGYPDTDSGKTFLLETPFHAVAAALVYFHQHSQTFEYTPEECGRIFEKAKALFQDVFATAVFASEPNADDLAARNCQQLLEECKQAYHSLRHDGGDAVVLTSPMRDYDEKVCLLRTMALAVESQHSCAQHMPMLSSVIVRTVKNVVERQHKDQSTYVTHKHVVCQPPRTQVN